MTRCSRTAPPGKRFAMGAGQRDRGGEHCWSHPAGGLRPPFRSPLAADAPHPPPAPGPLGRTAGPAAAPGEGLAAAQPQLALSLGGAGSRLRQAGSIAAGGGQGPAARQPRRRGDRPVAWGPATASAAGLGLLAGAAPGSGGLAGGVRRRPGAPAPCRRQRALAEAGGLRGPPLAAAPVRASRGEGGDPKGSSQARSCSWQGRRAPGRSSRSPFHEGAPPAPPRRRSHARLPGRHPSRLGAAAGRSADAPGPRPAAQHQVFAAGSGPRHRRPPNPCHIPAIRSMPYPCHPPG